MRVPYHSFVRPQVEVGRGDVQIRMVSVNIPRKQSRTVDKGWYSPWELGGGVITFHRKTQYVVRDLRKSVRIGLNETQRKVGYELWKVIELDQNRVQCWELVRRMLRL
jgi:hypothetical protein